MLLNKENSLILLHYKEPLTEIPKGLGHGYYGAIMVTLDGEKIQCHICGGLFEDAGTHARQKHQISHSEYRERFKLARSTSLISEKVREHRKAETLRWLANLTPEEKEKMKSSARAKYKEWRNKKGSIKFKIRLETKNKRGTCPDQLIAKIREVAKANGKTPTKSEFIVACGTQRYIHLIYKTFGSWEAALAKAGLEKNKRYTHKVGYERPSYSDEELLDILSTYWSTYKRVPTETDSRRGLIPPTQLYRRRWGSMEVARQHAGIRFVE